MDILLLLLEPGRLLVGDNLVGNVLAGEELHYGQMPWCVLSDVLFTKKREFVGVVFYVNEADARVAERFAAACDPRIALYLPQREAAKLPRYKSVLGNNSVLELRWSSNEPDEEEVTQLTDDWYYKTANPAEDECPCAWGYSNIEGILASKRLSLPELHY